MVRLLIALEHRIVREGLRSLLSAVPELEVVGEAQDGREAVRSAAELVPDITLMSTDLPGLSGVEAARAIGEAAPSVRVLMVSAHRNTPLVLDALRAGACGYLLQTSTAAECIEAIRAVVAGQTYLSPAVAGAVRADYVAGCRRTAPSPRQSLTARECEVLALIADGHSSKEIARKLCLSTRTVEKHRGRLMEKVGLRGIAELTKFAIREGMTTY